VDRFTGMAVFAKVVDTSSFSGAARHFDMSPATVSKYVQVLEERLGVRLLNRTTRHVNATEVGKRFYERCLRILSELEEAERDAGDLQRKARGSLRLTAPVSFGTRRIAPAIADYLASHPDVSVDLNLDDPYVNLLEERFDLAIRLGSLIDSSLIARKLCTLEMILCASPGYLAKNGAPLTPGDLINHNCLTHSYLAPHWSFVDQNKKEEAVRVSGRFRADSADALLPLALGDAGIALGPDYLLEDDLKAGRLIRLLPQYATHEIPVHAVYPHSHFLPAKIRTFIDFLASRFAHVHETNPTSVNGKPSRQAPPALHTAA
jgi:DNA-binding transcriptional LysR family regulator